VEFENPESLLLPIAGPGMQEETLEGGEYQDSREDSEYEVEAEGGERRGELVAKGEGVGEEREKFGSVGSIGSKVEG